LFIHGNQHCVRRKRGSGRGDIVRPDAGLNPARCGHPPVVLPVQGG
jgi:hypothetical protein